MGKESTLAWLRDDLVRGMPHFISPAWVKERPYFDAVETVAAWPPRQNRTRSRRLAA